MHTHAVCTSKSLLRPNQGYFVDDQKAIQSILHCLIKVFHDPTFISNQIVQGEINKTRNSLFGYALDLKEIYPKLMVIRVDFITSKLSVEPIYRYNALKMIREQLLGISRLNSPVAQLLLNWSMAKQRAYTCLFLGWQRQMRTDARIGRIFGEYWKAKSGGQQVCISTAIPAITRLH